MIKYKVGNILTNVRQWTFPGGEVGLDINQGSTDVDLYTTFVFVSASLQNSEDVQALIMATDAIRRKFPCAQLALELGYVPYARQDRVCNAGEALSIKVFANQINALKYNFVEIIDPHSLVTPALIDNCSVIDQFEVFGRAKNFADYTLVAPDLGALKKVEDFAIKTGAKGVVAFHKIREMSTGKIIRMQKVLGEIKQNEKYLVLDDICDGGKTFVEVAKFFRDWGADYRRLELMISHGIFSKGLDSLLESYDHIYTTDTLPQIEHPNLTVVKRGF